MTAVKPSSNFGRGRRAIVGLVITCAMAAVAAAVALNGRHAQATAIPSDDSGAAKKARTATTGSDPSLPAARDVLEGVPAATGDPAPTF